MQSASHFLFQKKSQPSQATRHLMYTYQLPRLLPSSFTCPHIHHGREERRQVYIKGVIYAQLYWTSLTNLMEFFNRWNYFLILLLLFFIFWGRGWVIRSLAFSSRFSLCLQGKRNAQEDEQLHHKYSPTTIMVSLRLENNSKITKPKLNPLPPCPLRIAAFLRDKLV